MGLFSADIETMDDLFVHTLKDIYYAENQIVKALPDMIEKATDPKLKDMILTNNSRLSVQPVTAAEWKQVCKMGGVKV